jgi:dolichol-phosphate mannosyltransferase
VEYLQHLVRLRFSRSARFIRFCIVGFSGVFVDLGVFWFLRDGFGLGLTRSTVISAEVAIVNNFLWNDLWTFGDIARRQPGKRQRIKRLIKFNVICLMGIVLQTLLVNFFFAFFESVHFTQTFGTWLRSDLLSKLVAIFIVTFWNYWLNSRLSWRVTDVD